MISHPYKCIFIHIPKTGGTSVQKVIWPRDTDLTIANLWCNAKASEKYNKFQLGGLQHLYAKNVKKIVGDQVFESYYKFSIVRNPWDKVVSQFVFMSKRQNLRKIINMTQRTSLLEYLNLIQETEHPQWAPQYKFVLDDDKQKLTDDIFRFESYETSFKRILEKIMHKQSSSSSLNLPHFKKARRENYQYYYNHETKNLVKKIYKEDLDLFEYSF